MGSLQEQLLKRNLASSRVVQELEAEEMFRREEQEKNVRKAAKECFTSQDLVTCAMDQFRLVAEHLLVVDRGAIKSVVTQAHRFKEQDGGKRLIWQVLQTRDALTKVLPTIDRARYRQFIGRCLRRNNPKFNIDF